MSIPALLTTLLILTLLSIQVSAQSEPVLHFSDLDWGPRTGWEGSATRGAAVTIWGEGFGSSGYDGADNYVTVNDAEITDYAEWGEDLGPARDLDRITFWLNSNCQDGPGQITVTVDGVTSNPLPFTVMDGDIYFISVADGDNGNDGLYSTDQGGGSGPWRDIYMFNPGRNPSGDGQYIVYVRDGIYTERDVDEAFVALRGPYGGPDQRKALIGYPLEFPVINLTTTGTSNRGLIWDAKYPPYGFNDYFTYSKLHCINGRTAISLFGINNRVVGCHFEDMLEYVQSGVVMVDNSQQSRIYGNHFDHCGNDSWKHQVYLKTHAYDPGLTQNCEYNYVGWNEITDPYASDTRGGGMFCSTQSTAHPEHYTNHIYFHDNYFHGGNTDFIYTGDNTGIYDIYVYNNIFRGGSGSLGGIVVYRGTHDIHFYNNIFYRMGDPGVGMVFVNWQASDGNYFKNNIWHSNEGQAFTRVENGGDFQSDNDMFYDPDGSTTPPGGAANLLTGDPLFSSPNPSTLYDFQLQPESPAIDNGTSDVSSIVIADFLGTTRPQGSGYDIGAYEFVQAQQCTEDWVCSDWSSCSEGQQTRVCTDQNSCGTENDKPDESQTCTELGPGPVLFFSDLTSAPNTGWEESSTKGAAVTIWGLNLGSSRGSSYVTVNGVDLTSDSDYAEWGATEGNAKLDAQHTQQRITFWLNSGIPAGTAKITVTVNGAESNELDFTVRELGSNHIWFVDSSSGDDSNSGSRDSGEGGGSGPWQTIQKADPDENPAVTAGDIIYIRDGIYDNDDGDGYVLKTYGTPNADGTATHPFAFVGYPTERPDITIDIFRCENAGGGTSAPYYTFSKLKHTGPESLIMRFWGGGFRVIGLYFDHTQTQGYAAMLRPAIGDDYRFYGNLFKGGGFDNWGHLIYGQCSINANHGDLTNVHIAYNEVLNYEPDCGDCGGPGADGGAVFNFRQDATDGRIIDDVFIHHNYMHDSSYGQFLYLEQTGGDNYGDFYVYDNLIHDINQYGGGSAVRTIHAQSDADIYCYNNIFYDCGGAQTVVRTLTSTTLYSSNNIYYTTGDSYIEASDNSVIISENDIFYGNGDPLTGTRYTYTNEQVTDPLFSDIAGDDYTLQATSPAIDAGTSDVSSLLLSDLLGNPRPMDGDESGTAEFDIGAYEYTGDYSYSHPADTSGEGCVDMGELNDYINLWFQDSQGVSMVDVMDAISFWRAGTGC